MSNKISRRDFLKISGIGVTAAAVLTGCGPASRYVVRQSYVDMPEYNQTGKSTFYATTCRECPAGCGLIVRTQEGRAIKIEGNPNHPVNRGKICSRGLTSVQGLYNPDRIGGPHKHTRGDRSTQPITWEEAITTVQKGLSNPAKTAFLLGLMPDHLFDLLAEFSETSGAPAPVRYSALGTLEGRATLLAATETMYGAEQFPYFDMGSADVVFNFGADYLETWLSPVAYSRGYRSMRKQDFGKRGYVVAFGARQSLTASNADEWIPVTPGSEGLVALAIGQIAARIKGQKAPQFFATVDVNAAAEAAGITPEKLQQLGQLFANAGIPLAIPGGAALTTDVGFETAQAILGLNILADNLGKPGGVYLAPGTASSANMQAVKDLIQRCQNGEVDTLFIHGCNPVFELAPSLGFEKALGKVKTVISFAPFEDETAFMSDYVFPDHTGLESFGYQRMLAGSDRSIYSSLQPVVQPVHNTKSTVDVFLAAAAAIPSLTESLNYMDEVDFIQQKISSLIRAGGFYTANEMPTFWSKWLQFGGWWKTAANLGTPRNAIKINTALA
jgi:anaerobic selenocysteine-containing dehydrogenase